MNHKPDEILEDIKPAQLEQVTGAGIGSMIGQMFGAKGAQFGGMADQLIGSIKGMFSGGGGGGGGGDTSATAGG